MAVKSVYEVQVDDAAFVAFAERFNGYLNNIKEANDSLGEMEKIGGSILAGFQAIADVMAQQRQMEVAAAKEEKERAAEEARKKKELEERINLLRKAREEQEKTWKLTVQTAKEIGGMAVNIAKMIGGFEIVGGILGGFGLDKLITGPATDLRTAQGYNITSGGLIGLRREFSPLANVDTTLENIAQMQFDPRARAAWNLMGIKDPQNKSVEDLFLEVMGKIGPAFRALGENPLLAHARMLDRFVDMDTMRRLANPENAGRVAIAEEQFRARSAEWKNIDAVNRQWQDFLVNLKYATELIGVSLVKNLLPLKGGLEGLAIELADFVKTFTGSAGFKKLMTDFGQAMMNLVNDIKSGRFEENVKQFMTEFGELAEWVHQMLVKLGIIQPTADEAVNMAGEHNFDVQTTQKGMLQPGFGRPGGVGAWAVNIGNFITGKGDAAAHQKRVLEDLRHFDPQAKAAVMGNIYGENNLFDPFAWGDPDKRTGKKTAYGLFQWHKDRRDAYAKMFGHTMESVKDWQTAIDEQIKFAVAEAHGDVEGGIYATPSLFRGAQAGTIVGDLVHRFERSKNQGRDTAIRTQAAREILVIIQAPPGSNPQVSAKAAAGAAGSGG